MHENEKLQEESKCLEDNSKEASVSFSFNTLAPVELKSEEYKSYESVINQALSDDRVRNIAISGGYGAGKSSIIETAKSRHSNLKWIDISLAHFQTEAISNQDDLLFESADEDDVVNHQPKQTLESKPKSTSNLASHNNSVFDAEAALLNQIIFQVDPKKAPLSRFKRIVVKDKKDIHRFAVLLMFFSILMLYLVYFFSLRPDINPIGSGEIVSLATFLIFSVWGWVLAIIAFVLVIVLLVKFIKTQFNTNALSKIVRRFKWHDTEIELFEGERKSPLEEYTDEIVYLLSNSGFDIVVFEDLDRFNSVGMLERLRAINSLVNNERKISDKDKKKRGDAGDKRQPIKFIYLIRDSVFYDPSDRTKFFDLIIPVIPFIDIENSFAVLKQRLEDFGIYPNDVFLYQLSLFISDPRILFEIANESAHFKNNVLERSTLLEEMDDVKIVALMAYKVMFPADFELMRSNSSFVDVLLDSRNALIDKLINGLRKERSSLTEKKKDLETKVQLSDESIDWLYIIPQFNSIRTEAQRAGVEIEDAQNLFDYRQQFEESEALSKIFRKAVAEIEDPDYPEVKENSKANLATRIALIEKRIQDLDEQISQIEVQGIPDLIQQIENTDDFFKIPLDFARAFGEETSRYKRYKEVYNSSNFGLIKFLISEGYVDGSRHKYISRFHKGGMPFEDREYFVTLIQGGVCDPSQVIIRPDLMLMRLSNSDLSKRGSRNYSLFSYMIKNKEDLKIDYLFRGINLNQDYSFIVDYVCSGNFNSEMFQYLSEHIEIEPRDIIENEDFSKDKRRVFCQKAVFLASDSFVLSAATNSALSKFASDDPKFLCLDKSISNVNALSLTRICYQPSDIDVAGSNDVLVKEVYSTGQYLPVADLVIKLLAFNEDAPNDLSAEVLIEVLAENQELNASKHVSSNADIFIQSVIDGMKEDEALSFENDKPIVWILNLQELSIDLAREIISRIKAPKINSISRINNDAIKTVLLEYALVNNTTDNILSYFMLNKGKEIDKTLASYLNIHELPTDFTFSKIIKIVGNSSFLSAIITCPHLEDKKVFEITSKLNRTYKQFPFTRIAADRANYLIKNGTIALTKENLLWIRENYSDEDLLELVSTFAIKDPAQYIFVVSNRNDESLFDSEEAFMLLKDNRIHFNYQKKLLKGFSGYIDVDLRYRDSVNEEIVRHHYDPNTTQGLINIYSKLGSKAKAATIEFLYKLISKDSLRELVIIRPCLDDLITSYKWNEDWLVSIIESQAYGSTPSLYKRSDIAAIFKIAKLESFYGLMNGDRVRVRNTSENVRLLKTLKVRGLCGECRLLKNGLEYTVYPKGFNKNR